MEGLVFVSNAPQFRGRSNGAIPQNPACQVSDESFLSLFEFKQRRDCICVLPGVPTRPRLSPTNVTVYITFSTSG